MRKHTLQKPTCLTCRRIVDVLSGTEWDSDTVDEIATILRHAGHKIVDVDETTGKIINARARR